MTEPPRFESWVDRQIREAIERGEFDNLPGAGKPIENLDDRDENWWVRDKMRRENLPASLPTPLALRKERETIDQTLADVRSEDDARAIIEDLNQRIRESYARPSNGPRIIVPLLDVEATLQRWRERRDPRSASSQRGPLH